MLTKKNDLLGTLIHDVAHLLRHEIDRRVGAYNLTRTKWLAISLLRDNPGGTQRELARRLELGAAATGRLVDRLVERGFVERRSDKTDRRAHRLHLTQAAQNLLIELETEAELLRRDLLEGFSAGQIDQIQEGLLKLKTRLQSLGTPQ